MDSLNQHKSFAPVSSKRRAVIITALVVLAICLGLLLSGIDVDGMLRFSDRLAIFPTVEMDYRRIIDTISNTTNDTLLKKMIDVPLRLMRHLYPGCISGGFDYIFGTNRAYSDVLADYREVFSGLGWEQRANGEVYGIKTAVISLTRIDPSSPDYALGKGQYQTVYSLLLAYDDPAVLSCSG